MSSLHHPTAIIEATTKIGDGTTIGPYAVIGPEVEIGKNCKIHGQCCIAGNTKLGDGCEVFPFASVGQKTQDLKYQEGNKTYVEIGNNTVIRECATVHSGTMDGEVTKVGSNCLLMAYTHVAHGCVVGSHVIMSNNATLAGEATVGDGAILGGFSAVKQFGRIGKSSFVTGQAAVNKDIVPYMIGAGNYAKNIGINSVGLQRAGFDTETRLLIKRVYKILFREELSTSQALEKIKAEIEMTEEVKIIVDFVEASKFGIAR
jgi:UDP-N-acetylglucosamine acyltransferase